MNDQTRTEEYSQVESQPQPGTEVAVRAPVKAPLPTGAKIAAIIPRTFDEAWRIAQAVVKAGMVQRDLKSPERALIAIMHGLEIGLPPQAAIQSIAVINGRPSVYGSAVMGIVMATNQVVELKEYFEGEGDALAVVQEGRIGRGVGHGGAQCKGASSPVRGRVKSMALTRPLTRLGSPGD